MFLYSEIFRWFVFLSEYYAGFSSNISIIHFLRIWRTSVCFCLMQKRFLLLDRKHAMGLLPHVDPPPIFYHVWFKDFKWSNVGVLRYRTALETTDNIEDGGGMNWKMFGCLAGAWLLLFVIVFRGVQSVGKVSRWDISFISITLIHDHGI